MRKITTALRKWSLLFLVLLIPVVSGVFPLLSETAHAAPNNTPSSAAQDNCQNQTGNAQKACETGYDNPNDKKACDSYKGNDKTACTDAQSTAKNTGSNGSKDTSPTCDVAVTNPFSWVLCPIFDLISDFAHWMLQGVVQPFLVTQPISTDPNDMVYQIWSNFRIYGDIFLVIALLVIVFSESIGGGMLDAYTVKKVLPRLLAAAIMINLSIYIVAFLVDFTNILGQGVSNLLAAPLTHCTHGSGNCWDFHLSVGDGIDVFGVGLIGLLAGGTALAGAIGALIFGGAAAASTMLTAAFFVALPVVFAILGVFLTLVFRKGLILFLVLASPVACALYVLPNTSRYFKKWWDLLLEALMVYPIIMVVFGVADILSVTMLQANNITPTSLTGTGDVSLDHTLALVTAFMLQFLPLLAIPFAFRFASGALRRIYDAATTAGAQVHKAATTQRERYKEKYKVQSTQARERSYRNLNAFGDQHRSVRGASRFLARRAGGYDPLGMSAAVRAEQMKAAQATNDTGDDTEYRALSVNKAWADRHGREGVDWRLGDNGTREYRTLGGAWVGEDAVDSAHARWGGNQAMMQWSLGHEMEKATTQEDQDYLRNNFGNVMTGGATGEGSWGLSDGELQGMWKGAGFAKQNINRQWKHYAWQGDGNGGGDLQMGGTQALAMFREMDEKQGSYEQMRQNADTWTTMSQSMERAQQTLIQTHGRTDADAVAQREVAEEILQRGARIAHATRSSSMASTPIMGDDGTPTAMVPGGSGRDVGAGAAGRVQEEMHRFVNISDGTAGRYQAPAGEAPISVRPAEASRESLNRRGSDRPGPGPSGTGGVGPRAD